MTHLLSDLDNDQQMEAEPKAPHTILIIVGALAILWILGAVTFKGIRQ
jgi:hypothetical protein